MNPETEVNRLLKLYKCKPRTSGKHIVYRLPSGEMFTVAKTPSDHRAAANNLAILRSKLGLLKRGNKRAEPNTRVEPKPTRKPPVRRMKSSGKGNFVEEMIKLTTFREAVSDAFYPAHPRSIEA